MSASFKQALTVLGAVVGSEFAQNACEAQSYSDRSGTWVVRSDNGETLAEINPAHGSCIVSGFSLFAGELAQARVITTRVMCQCGAPKILPGRVQSGAHYVCSECKRTAFVVLD